MGNQQLLIILLGIIAVGVAIAIGISLYSGQSIINNKDNLLNSITYISGDAFAYFQRVNIMGGGSGTYNNYIPPYGLRDNDDGTITVIVGGGGLTIEVIGTSKYGYGTVRVTFDKDGHTMGLPTYSGQFGS